MYVFCLRISFCRFLVFVSSLDTLLVPQLSSLELHFDKTDSCCYNIATLIDLLKETIAMLFMKSKNIHLLFVKSKNIHQSLLSKHIYQLFVKLVKFGHIGNQLVTSIESQDMSAFIYIYVCVSHIQIQPSILQQNQMALMLQKNAKTTHLSTFC